MERIVFLERSTFKVEFRRPQFEHEWIDYAETAPDQVIERLQDATIAICNKLPLRAPDLSRLPQLKLIAVAATGVDNIDLAPWTSTLPITLGSYPQPIRAHTSTSSLKTRASTP